MVLLNGASVLESGAQLVSQMGEHLTGDRRAASWRLNADGVTFEQDILSPVLELMFDPGRQEIVPTRLKNC